MTPEGPIEIGARRGVLLAAGGFEGNEAMRRDHDVPGDTAWTMAPRGTNTGEPIAGRGRARRGHRLPPAGLVLPRARAARRRRLLHARLPQRADGRPGRPPLRQRVPALRPVRPGDGQGAGADPVLVRLRLPRGRPAARRSRCPRATRPPTSRPAPGSAPRPSSELAAAAGLPPDALAETVERFNGYAETGVDEEFHRGEDEYDTFFAGGHGAQQVRCRPLDAPPYFAARFVLSDLGTKGGLVTDAAGRVLRADGTPIPGLYAAGNTAASVFGSVYPGPGAPLGLGDGLRRAGRRGPAALGLARLGCQADSGDEGVGPLLRELPVRGVDPDGVGGAVVLRPASRHRPSSSGTPGGPSVPTSSTATSVQRADRSSGS